MTWQTVSGDGDSGYAPGDVRFHGSAEMILWNDPTGGWAATIMSYALLDGRVIVVMERSRFDIEGSALRIGLR